MAVVRYRDVGDMPPAIQADADMTPADGLRLACELSEAALRLAGALPTGTGVRPHPMLTRGDAHAEEDGR